MRNWLTVPARKISRSRLPHPSPSQSRVPPAVAFAIMEENASANPAYRKVYDAFKQWRDASFRWFGTNEQAYATFFIVMERLDGTELTRIEAKKNVRVTSKDGQTATGDWADFDAKGVEQSEHQIRRTMDDLMAEAIEQVKS